MFQSCSLCIKNSRCNRTWFYSLIFERICFSFFLEKLLNEYERILSFTIFGIKKPFEVSFTQRLIMVLFVHPSFLLTSIGVNSNIRFLRRYTNKSFSFVFKYDILPSNSSSVDSFDNSQTLFEYSSIMRRK